MGMTAFRNHELLLNLKLFPARRAKNIPLAPNSIAPGDVPSKISGITPMRREYSSAICGMCSWSADSFPEHRHRAARAAAGYLAPYSPVFGPRLRTDSTRKSTSSVESRQLSR